jgi:hypothetical protein
MRKRDMALSSAKLNVLLAVCMPLWTLVAWSDEVRINDLEMIEVYAVRFDVIPPGAPPESVRTAPDIYLRARSVWSSNVMEKIVDTMRFDQVTEPGDSKPLAKVLFVIDLHAKSGDVVTYFGDYYRIYNHDFSRFRTFDCATLKMYFDIVDPLRIEEVNEKLLSKCSADASRKR